MADADSNPPNKTCTRCGKEKPLDAFHADKALRGGYRHQCRACRAAPRRTRLALNRISINATRRANRAADPEGARIKRRLSYPRERAQEQLNRQQDLDAARKRDRIKWFAYHEKNKKRVRTHRQKYAAIYNARRRAQHAISPEIEQSRVEKRRAFRQQADVNDLTAQDWRDILAAYGHRCVYCGRKMQRLTQDHITPLSKGGNHTKNNVVPACRSCNCSKGNRPAPIPVQPLLL